MDRSCLKSHTLAIVLSASTIAAQGADAPDGDNPFAKGYLILGLSRNFPATFSQNEFDPGHSHPTIGYRHSLNRDWIMGVGGHFKLLNRKVGFEGDRHVAIFTLTHETYYAVRVSHPLYFITGPKLQYLLPTRGARLPLQRSPSLPSEIGIAYSLALMRLMDENHHFVIRIERWRGTKTTRLQGTEVAFEYGWTLGD